MDPHVSIPSMTTFGLYRAEGLAPLAAIADEGALMRVLGQVMLGWKLVPAGEVAPGFNAPVRITQCAEGWRCEGVTFDKPVIYADPVATACALLAALYKAHTCEDDTSLVLHAGGVRIGAGLVLVTGHYNCGKTVFAAACAAAGLQVFSDDIIPVDPAGPVALAPGLGIRLRLPLPDILEPSTRSFIDRHHVAGSDRYAYIRPPADLLARRGEAAPIAGVVSLRRVEEGAARIAHLPPADALSEVILRNFARETSARVILDTLDAVVASVPCLALTYSRPEEAVALMREAFERGPAHIADVQSSRKRGSAGCKVEALPSGVRIERATGVTQRMRGDQAFLTDAQELVIFNLNATGAAVWHALGSPKRFGDLTDIFQAAFPDQDRTEIAADLSSLIDGLARAGLVRLD